MELLVCLGLTGATLMACAIWRHLQVTRGTGFLIRYAEEKERQTLIAPPDPRVNVNWKRQAESRAVN